MILGIWSITFEIISHCEEKTLWKKCFFSQLIAQIFYILPDFINKDNINNKKNKNNNFQIAMANHLFEDGVEPKDLPCMNCTRVEMGERACYTGICDMCGKVPPCLR